MADRAVSPLPPPTAEQRRIAAERFERANQVVASGNFDYGISLLLTCCKFYPTNLLYRQALRRTQRARFNNNLRGSWFAFLTNSLTKARIRSARKARKYLKVLEHGEVALVRNPWDIGVQMDMAEAARGLGQLDLAVWILDQARQKDPRDTRVNRELAQLQEKRGNFTQAICFWELVRQADPEDLEAQHKAKDLAASHTIARGKYVEMISRDENDPEGRPPISFGPTEAEAARTAPPESRWTTEAEGLHHLLVKDPTDAHLYVQLAMIYRRAGQIDQARTILQDGLGPTGHDFRLVAALAEVELEPFRRNLDITETKLQDLPQDEELRKIRIRLLKEINTRELELFRLKADRFPTELSHRLELGVRLLRAGQLDEAIVELQAARNDARHRGRALLYLGYCFKGKNNWRLARRNFEEALEELPPADEAVRKEILFQLAQGCAEAGDLAKAIDLGSELANLDFAYRDIGRMLDDWQARLQQSKVGEDGA
jgi:tetratricopeptide (TPR) repeat protein